VGALLVSLYNMASVQAGVSGVLDFCFFLVVFTARCVSSISARFFLYGAHVIYFLPLVTILEPRKKLFPYISETKELEILKLA
jgi:hypothetical protein